MEKYNYNDVKIDEKVFIFIYGCALRDAILQKSYVGKRTWIGSDVPEAQGYVKDYINRVLMGDFRKDDETVKKDHDMTILLGMPNSSNIKEAPTWKRKNPHLSFTEKRWQKYIPPRRSSWRLTKASMPFVLTMTAVMSERSMNCSQRYGRSIPM